MATKARDAFRTISEVADWLDVPAHVLRFWESKFSHIKPVKRAGGRRYYRPDDMLLIGGIKKLLHDDGMTIRGVQKMLKEEGVKTVAALSQSLDGVDEAASPRTKRRKDDAEAEAGSAEIETTPEKDNVEDAETVAAWTADAEAESAPEPDARGAMHIDPGAAQPAEDAEAATTSEPEPEPEEADTGADNVVAMPSRSQPEPEPETEPEPEAEEAEQTAFDLADAPDADQEEAPAATGPVDAPAPESDPQSEAEAEPEPEAQPVTALDAPEPGAATAVHMDPDREKTLPPTELPSDMAAEPATTAEETEAPVVADRSDAQAAARALKRVLRGSDSTTLAADPALAAHTARLAALRDRIAAQVSGD